MSTWGFPRLMLGSPGTVRRFFDEASAALNPRNAESNKNETKKIDKKMIKGITAFFMAHGMMVVPCKSHQGKVSNRQSNCRRAPWYRLYMWRVLVLKVGPRASFLEDLVGLREKSTVHFPPKNVVDTQYVLAGRTSVGGYPFPWFRKSHSTCAMTLAPA